MNQQLENHILIGLFKATIEHSTMLKNQFNHKPKQVFNLWQSQGNTLLNELEKRNEINEDYINSITDIIHNIMDGIRKDNAK
tara:strand:+ start:384 stop:629 length:246 start_codon:yes stop_codon:yes gene_type:complete